MRNIVLLCACFLGCFDGTKYRSNVDAEIMINRDLSGWASIELRKLVYRSTMPESVKHELITDLSNADKQLFESRRMTAELIDTEKYLEGVTGFKYRVEFNNVKDLFLALGEYTGEKIEVVNAGGVLSVECMETSGCRNIHRLTIYSGLGVIGTNGHQVGNTISWGPSLFERFRFSLRK